MIKIRVNELIEELKKLRQKNIVYVRDYQTGSLKEVQEVETVTGQICLIV